MKIVYYVPENDRPSWGAGMIYYHVWLLHKNNFEAYILHETQGYKLPWLSLDVPKIYLGNSALKLNIEDVLVIPEYYASLEIFKKLKSRKIVFVQNAFYIFDGLKDGSKYEEMGISDIFYYLPHLQKVLRSITSVPLYETPAFIAPYYFDSKKIQRKKKILVYPKFENRDYTILIEMLSRKLGIKPRRGLQKLLCSRNEWELVELKNLSHTEVSDIMKESMFFVCLNSTEAFNSAVPEAMAAGCINICYEAVGPADFLENNVNAFVFPNHHIYPLVEKLAELVNGFETHAVSLELMRNNALDTAKIYSVENLEKKLIPFFNNLKVQNHCIDG